MYRGFGEILFFFKQQTAYDMRIRDWSSNVCSSDLNALAVGKAIEGRVARMLHPGLPSHPQHELAMRQMDACGPIFAFELPGGTEQAMAFLNALDLLDISNNIGDARSLCCHPWTTTHYGVSPDEIGRASCGERGCPSV